MKENNKSNFTFIDLFSGIGGFRIALEKIGGKCLGFSEIANTAIETYKLNWPKDGKNHDLGSITELNKLPKHDILVGGVPCQSWSIAGKNKGIEDKRGALWNDVIRLVSINKPKAFVFENKILKTASEITKKNLIFNYKKEKSPEGAASGETS